MYGKPFLYLVQLFATEIVNWDREQEQKRKKGDGDCQEGVLIGDDPECQIIEKDIDHTSSHGILAQNDTQHALEALSSRLVFDKRKAGSAANAVVEQLTQMAVSRPKYAQLAKAQGLKEVEEDDKRLQSFLHYLAAVNVREEVFRRALLEQVAFSGLQTASEAARLVIQEAKELLASEAFPGVLEESSKWHLAYHNFRCVEVSIPFLYF